LPQDGKGSLLVIRADLFLDVAKFNVAQRNQNFGLSNGIGFPRELGAQWLGRILSLHRARKIWEAQRRKRENGNDQDNLSSANHTTGRAISF
jgi:hypothetical protein